MLVNMPTVAGKTFTNWMYDGNADERMVQLKESWADALGQKQDGVAFKGTEFIRFHADQDDYAKTSLAVQIKFETRCPREFVMKVAVKIAEELKRVFLVEEAEVFKSTFGAKWNVSSYRDTNALLLGEPAKIIQPPEKEQTTLKQTSANAQPSVEAAEDVKGQSAKQIIA